MNYEEGQRFRRRLKAVISWALQQHLKEQGKASARAIAAKLDAGEYRVRTTCDLDARSGEPVLDSLRYVVEIFWLGGWEELVTATWTALGVSEANAVDELRLTLLQNGVGIPDDPSALMDSPP